MNLLSGAKIQRLLSVLESPYYRGFFKKIHDNFVETLETVRNREVSVLERCPYREVPLYFFSSSTLLPLVLFYFFKICIENHIKHYFGRHFINSNTVGSRACRSTRYKLWSIGEKAPKLWHVCFPWFLVGQGDVVPVLRAVLFPFVAITEFKSRHSRSRGVSVVNRSGPGFQATCWHTQAHSLHSQKLMWKLLC